MADSNGEKILIKISHYNPFVGGVNCLTFVDGECISTMANGERWQDWMGKAIACPHQLPFETRIVIDGKEWICKDRGNLIVFDSYAYWIDQLTENPEYDFGTLKEAIMYRPAVEYNEN